jgi:DNA recombination protein RmuC
MEIVLIIFSSITILLVSILIFIFLKKPQETGLRELQNELTEKFTTNLERLSNISRNIDSIKETASTMSIPIQNLNTYLGGNVTAGRLGEWNLESLVADVLPNTKFKTQKNLNPANKNRVDVAVQSVEGFYIPIDSKFYSQQYADYQAATTAADRTSSLNQLKASIKSDAEEIVEKYFLEGVTSGFGVLYVPSEGLVAMVNLIEDFREILFREYKILVLGPNSLAGFLDQIRMGHDVVVLNENASIVKAAIVDIQREFLKLDLKTVELENSLKTMTNKVGEYQAKIRALGRSINTANTQMEALEEDGD